MEYRKYQTHISSFVCDYYYTLKCHTCRTHDRDVLFQLGDVLFSTASGMAIGNDPGYTFCLLTDFYCF